MLPEKVSQQIKETHKQVLSQSFSLINSAFILVAALAWNDLIKDVITTYFKTSQGLISRLFYAVIVTVIAVLITMKLSGIAQKLAKDSPQNEPN